MPIQTNAFLAEEQSPDLASAYCYAIGTPDGQGIFLTTWDVPITISGLPAYTGSNDPQVFQPGQVRHGPININDRFESRATALTLTAENEELRRYFTTAAPARLSATILRIVGANLRTSQSLQFDRHCMIADRGIISSFTFRGMEIGAALTPEAFHEDRAIPRYYCQRRCNHALYGAGCGLNKNLFKFDTSIVSINAAQKEIVVVGQKDGVPETRFNAGHLYHEDTGFNFTIAWSAYSGINTKFKLITWHPELEPGDLLTAYYGCQHTTVDCALFGNLANFGGFPYVPASNPTLNSVS
jgi:hypothetical protein